MNITLVSHFRNAESYIMDYIERVVELRNLLEEKDHRLYLVLGYGDSQDLTSELLKSGLVGYGITHKLVDVSHGGPEFGSVLHRTRFEQLSKVANTLWSEVYKLTDYVLVVESDLAWEPASLVGLVEASQSIEKATTIPTLLAPMVKASEGRFYDIWAFRINGKRFDPQPPYHPALATEHRYVALDSMGSCFVAPWEAVKDLSFPPGNVIVGFSKAAKAKGIQILLDRETEVYHP